MKPLLVVDDEPQMRLLIKTLFLKECFESLEAGDGCSAFATAKKIEGEISRLLTDINMPGSPMNGVELAGAVKSEFPEIPVLFVSSEPRSFAELDAAAPGNLFIKKPFDLREFVCSDCPHADHTGVAAEWRSGSSIRQCIGLNEMVAALFWILRTLERIG